MTASKTSSPDKMLLLTPVFGIWTFVLLYIIAASLYPGGSFTDPQARGFNLLHNYWCDLFDIKAHNGTPNPARPIAISAMLVLTASFGLLWYLLPGLFEPRNKRLAVLQYTGIGSMVISVFLFTRFHEEVINFGGFLGGIALTLTFLELYKAGKKMLFTYGVLCLVLCCVNYFIYETKFYLSALAGLQKVTFLAFFIWASLINLDLYRKYINLL